MADNGLRRRTLVQGAAWTVPVIALAQAAPALAASGEPPCTTASPVDVLWKPNAPQYTYTRTGNTQGQLVVTGTGWISPVTVTFASTLVGSALQYGNLGVSYPTSNQYYTALPLSPEGNLGVLDGTTEPGAGHTIEAGQYFLAFKQSSIGNDPGDGSQYQEITVSFSEPVNGLNFYVHMIDALWTNYNMFEVAPYKHYNDRLTITSATTYTATPTGPAYVSGTGSTSSPLRGDLKFVYALPPQYVWGNNSAIVQFADGLTSFTMRFWNAWPSSATDPLAEQSFYLGEMTFAPSACA